MTSTAAAQIQAQPTADPWTVIRGLKGFRQTNKSQFQAHCPAHDDQKASLSIGVKTDGSPLLHCKAGCSYREILDALGLRKSDLRPSPGTGVQKREVATYLYQLADGTVAYRVTRYDPKDFRQSRPDGKGGWIWKMQGVRRIIYRLPEVKRSTDIWITEGEKDADNLHAIGIVGTCIAGGASAAWSDDIIQCFRPDQHIVILPDRDAPGEQYALNAAQALHGRVASIRILRLEGLPDHGDVSDWLKGRDPKAAREELLRLRDQVAEWTPAEQTITVSESWPEPEPIDGRLTPVIPFETALLPTPFVGLVVDVAEKMQVPMDFPAVVSVVCLAGVTGRRAIIQPKIHDTDWTVTPNLWGGIVAPPGWLKSPVIQRVMRPITRIEAEWHKEYEQESLRYRRELEEYELRQQAWKEEFKRAIKKGQPTPERPNDPPLEPRMRRLVVNDTTYERLQEINAQNPAGIIHVRDELASWLARLDRAEEASARGFFLSAANGDTGYTIDRIGRGTIRLEACCVSILGGIQPARLRSYLTDAVKDGPGNDGLIQRFQLLVWPELNRGYHLIDRAPDPSVEEATEEIYRSILRLSHLSPLRYRFGPSAQDLFYSWLKELEYRVRGDEMHPALTSHLAKYRSLMPSLAVLFQLAHDAIRGLSVSDPLVDIQHTRQAAAWTTYLESHARRIYGSIVTPEIKAAADLAEKIKARKIGENGTFTLRELYRRHWSGLDTPAAVRSAIEILEEYGWLREVAEESKPQRGRPSKTWRINPRVYDTKEGK